MRLSRLRRAAISSKVSHPYITNNGVMNLRRREEQQRRFLHKNIRTFRGCCDTKNICTVSFPSSSSSKLKLKLPHHRHQKTQSVVSDFIVAPSIPIQTRWTWSLLDLFPSSNTKKERGGFNQQEIQGENNQQAPRNESEEEDLVDDDIPSHFSASYRNIKDCEVRNIAKILPGDLLNGNNNTITLSDINALCEKLVTKDENFFDAFRLIHRLFWELNYCAKSNNNNKSAVSSKYDNFRTMAATMLQDTVQQWSIAYEKTKVQQTGSDPEAMLKLNQSVKIPTPDKVWLKVKQIQTTPSSEIINKIIEMTKYHQTRSNGRMSKFGPKLADELISLMMVRQSELPNPTIDSFNVALSSWEVYAKSMYFERKTKDFDYAIRRLLKLLELARQCDDVTPNRDTYQIIMRVLSYQGNGDKVEELLEAMYGTYLNVLENNDDAKDYMPSTECFSLVLFAWKQSDDATGIAAERATEILDKMLELETSQEIPGFKVTSPCFDIVLKCWSQVNNNNKARRGKMQTLYDRMVELSKMEPTKEPTAQTYAIMGIDQSTSEANETYPTILHEAEPRNLNPARGEVSGRQTASADANSQKLNYQDVEEVRDVLRDHAAKNTSSTRSLLFDMARDRPLETLHNYAQKMNGKIDYEVAAHGQHQTRMTCTHGTKKFRAEGVGMANRESRKAAALDMMDQLNKGRVNGALLDEAEARALPLQTLNNYMQTMRGTLDVDVTTTTVFETKATYTQGEIMVVAEGRGKTKQASKKAAAFAILSKLRADIDTRDHETEEELAS